MNNVISVKAGEEVVKKQDKVVEWYLIQEGSVVRKFAFEQVVMRKNSIIGILDGDWYKSDYVANEDTKLIVIPGKDANDLHKILAEHENFRPIFLRTAIEQRHQMLCLYASLRKKTNLLHSVVEELYEEYRSTCGKMLLDEQEFSHIEAFEAINMKHRVENWEISNSNCLVREYLRDYMQLMIRDDSLCVGAIMEASAQMIRVTNGITEMVHYLQYNKDILFSDTRDDIFHLFFDLAVQLSKKKQDIANVKGRMTYVTDVMKNLGIYDEKQIKEAEGICEGYDFEKASEGRINITKEDCTAFIMEYAGYDTEVIRHFKGLLESYRSLPDMLSTDDEARKLRKEISNIFYEVYEKAFMRSVEELLRPSPILLMFFNFGVMDVQMAGEENANALYNLTDSLGRFQSEHVFTIYEWLKCIYRGEKEPCRNEFDQDFNAYLLELKRQGDITEQQMTEMKQDTKKKVEFEINNMFKLANRVTYGRVTTFCPVIMEEDFINTVERMAVTEERIENAINKVRRVDYSALYHDVLFSDPEKGINQEWIKKEILPDVILMPNAGVRAQMWQEASGVKSDTPARFIFPIFTAADVDEMMVETIGRYRWEICRKVQGVYWNDISEKSLTAEYCDYIQFYRKNSELSADTKEKIKIALARARNSYREVFVKDYQAWMKYESQGSFRLTKVARNILAKYCPFAKEIRDGLLSNPQYQAVFRKVDIDNQKREQRLVSLYNKYEAAGGEITPELKENLRFCKL
ncbi:MAG: cyclic nucleotide-binding domain-containing protein [Lachnospiraceae bacterium]|nr:cyclic nucleotide-binding domain-containing protein [Lachnospiraceae bacterium]